MPGIKGFACDSDHKIFYNELKLKSLLDDFGFVSNKISYAPFMFKWFDKK